MNPADGVRPYLLLLAFAGLLWTLRRWGGRLAPQATIAPLVFLITRKAVLVAWAVGAVAMVALLVRGAAERGRDPMAEPFLLFGLSVFCGLGFAALTVGPLWMVFRAFTSAPGFPLETGETVLREFAANHFLKGEARGGRLLITSRRLGFKPHRFNVQLSPWSSRLDDIREFRCEGQRLLLIDLKSPQQTEWIVVQQPMSLAEYLGSLIRMPENERTDQNQDAHGGASLDRRPAAQ